MEVGLALVAIVVGLSLAAGSASFLRREAKYWNLRRLTLERFVAGGFMLGFVFVMVGFEVAGRGDQGGALPLALFLGLGAADLVFFLFFGLLCAYLPRLARRRRVLPGAYVVARRVVDEKMMDRGDLPFADEPGWRAYVSIRVDGALREVSATADAYDLATPGAFGAAEVRGDRLTLFRAHRTL
jgi:hypothetical protein